MLAKCGDRRVANSAASLMVCTKARIRRSLAFAATVARSARVIAEMVALMGPEYTKTQPGSVCSGPPLSRLRQETVSR
jgi:hypothetical protein